MAKSAKEAEPVHLPMICTSSCCFFLRCSDLSGPWEPLSVWPCGFVASVLGVVHVFLLCSSEREKVSCHHCYFIPFPPCPNPQSLISTQQALLQPWLSSDNLMKRDLRSPSCSSPAIPLTRTPPHRNSLRTNGMVGPLHPRPVEIWK